MTKSFATLHSHHICGKPFRVCNKCNRQFCSNCDGNLCTAYQTGLSICCREAIVEYWTEKDDMLPFKQKVVIKEITDGKL